MMKNHSPVAKMGSLIDQLTLEELRFLNRRIVERIKFIRKAGALSAMQKFNIGERVSFQNGDETVSGTIIRFNQKTISLVTDTQERWNVAPVLLTKII